MDGPLRRGGRRLAPRGVRLLGEGPAWQPSRLTWLADPGAVTVSNRDECFSKWRRRDADGLGCGDDVLTPVAPADLISRARAEGRISDEEQAVLAAVVAARAAFLAKAPPGTPSGLAPPGGTGRGETAVGAELLDGVVAPAAAAVSWYGGHLTLGRRP